MKDNVLAFISGFIPCFLSGIGQQILTTMLLGAVGGLVGLLVKDGYNFIKSKIRGRHKV